tara:strand:- start:355 stop:759 length:405 start_codon:yes stop_codon:yes gene_type:complete
MTTEVVLNAMETESVENKLKAVTINLLGEDVDFPIEIETEEALRAHQVYEQSPDAVERRIVNQRQPEWGKQDVLYNLLFDVARQIDSERMRKSIELYQSLNADGLLEEDGLAERSRLKAISIVIEIIKEEDRST